MRSIIFAALFVFPWIGISTSVALAQSAGDAQFTKAQIQALAKNPNVRAAISACSEDRSRLCSGVTPGGGRILRCLSENAQSLSQPCRSAIVAARDTVAVQSGK